MNRSTAIRCVLVGLVAAVVLASGLSARLQMPDFGVYLTAGQRVIAGESLYQVADGHWQYKYLPAFAFAVAPLSALPVPVARALWLGLSVGLLVAFVSLTLARLPDRRRPMWFLIVIAVIAMGKFWVRELGLGQSNILMGTLVMLSLAAHARSRETTSGIWLGLATLVKPYAIIFWPWLVWRRRWQAAAWFALVVALGVLLPVLRYGVGGTIDLMHGLWTVVTGSTAPNLLGQDTVSLAGLWASWTTRVGMPGLAGMLTMVSTLVVLGICVRELARPVADPPAAFVDTAVLLLLIPLVSPQGWDYVLLLGTPAVVCLIDRSGTMAATPRVLLWTAVLVTGLSIYDVLGREVYRWVMLARVISVCALIELGLLLVLRRRAVRS